jgi:coproporphyrinogen III oxidase
MLKGLLSRAKTKVRGLAGGIASGSVPGDATPGADLALERPPADSRARAKALLMGLQDSICAGLEALDGGATFAE